MQRRVFVPLLLSLTCVAPLALAAVPTDEDTPSLLSRIGMPEWPSDAPSKERELSLPIWAVLGASMLDFSGYEAKSAAPQRRVAKSPAARRPQLALRQPGADPKRLAVIRHRAIPVIRLKLEAARSAAEPQLTYGALY
jgi:hypothetical protein